MKRWWDYTPKKPIPPIYGADDLPIEVGTPILVDAGIRTPVEIFQGAVFICILMDNGSIYHAYDLRFQAIRIQEA